MLSCATCKTPARPGPCPFCGLLVVVGLSTALPADASDVVALYGAPATPLIPLEFSPDRPGVGDSTGTVGDQHLMIEGGLALVPTPTAFGTSGIIGRYGIGEWFEARARLPDITLADGVGVGSIGLGGKFAAHDDRFGVSLVPELAYDPSAGTLGGNFGGNATVGFGPFGLWVHTTLSIAQQTDPALLVGGGAAYGMNSWGIFANGGATLDSAAFVGGGGWLQVTSGVQLDAGVDVWLAGDTPTPVFGLGTSVRL